MKHIYSFRTFIVIFVLGIMLLSSILTGALLLVLMELNILRFMVSKPLLMFCVPLLVSIIIGTGISAIMSQHFLKPIRRLIFATQRVAKGDFSVRVPEIGTDSEMDRLIRSFNAMTEELAGTELFKKDFINIFSHEFKTPLVSIRGFAKQLQNENLSEKERREYADIIISECERLSKMSSNILLLTKLENQQIVGDKESFSLDEQLRSAILLLEDQWQKKEINWQLELDDVDFYGNDELLMHMWVNLLANAVKYSTQGADIAVRCCRKEQSVLVVIADHGEGIARQSLAHIFDKFYQADSSHSTEGNGLGLAIVHRISELCEAGITVESAPGQGTAFYVELPLEQPHENAAANSIVGKNDKRK